MGGERAYMGGERAYMGGERADLGGDGERADLSGERAYMAQPFLSGDRSLPCFSIPGRRLFHSQGSEDCLYTFGSG